MLKSRKKKDEGLKVDNILAMNKKEIFVFVVFALVGLSYFFIVREYF